MILPEFAEGIHYTSLRGGRYRFKLLQDIKIRLQDLAAHPNILSFQDFEDTEWMRIDHDTLILRAGYAWNGASPCVWIPFIGWVGTPTPYPAVLATLVHDGLYQFVWTENFPFSLQQCDKVFFEIMKSCNFKWANLYYGAVTDFGRFFAGKKPGGGDHSELLN